MKHTGKSRKYVWTLVLAIILSSISWMPAAGADDPQPAIPVAPPAYTASTAASTIMPTFSAAGETPLPTTIAFDQVSDPTGTLSPSPPSWSPINTEVPYASAVALTPLVSVSPWNNKLYNQREDDQLMGFTKWYGWDFKNADNNRYKLLRRIRASYGGTPLQRYKSLRLDSVRGSLDAGLFAIDDNLHFYLDETPILHISTADVSGWVKAISIDESDENEWVGFSATVASNARTAASPRPSGGYADLILEDYSNAGGLGEVVLTGVTQNRYRITTYGNGSVMAGVTPLASPQADFWMSPGENTSLKATPDDGFYFAGWVYNGVLYNPDTDSLSESHSIGLSTLAPADITAVFLPLELTFTKYVLNFDAYDPTSTDGPTLPKVVRKANNTTDSYAFSLTFVSSLRVGIPIMPKVEAAAAPSLADDESPVPVQTASTRADGTVAFTGLVPGYYMLRELGEVAVFSDIPHGLMLKVLPNGDIQEKLTFLKKDILIGIEKQTETAFTQSRAPEIQISDTQGEYNMFSGIIGNLQIPAIPFAKYVTASAAQQPTATTSTITMSPGTAYYRIHLKNPTNTPLFFLVHDQFDGGEKEGLSSPFLLEPGEEIDTDFAQYTYAGLAARGSAYVNQASLEIGSYHGDMDVFYMKRELPEARAISELSAVDKLPGFFDFRDFSFQGPQVGQASASVTVTTPSSPNPQPITTNNTLAVALEGLGTIVPGAGSFLYSTGSVVQMQAPVPATGWTFAGWFGTNGGEVKNNQIQMNGDKSIVARFTQEVIVASPSEIPQAAPQITQTPASAPETAIVEAIATPMEVPQAAPALPKTSGVPLPLMLLLGGLLTATGLSLRNRR